MVGDRTASGSAPPITTTTFRPRGRRFRVGAQLHGRDSVTMRIAYLPPYHLQTHILSFVPDSQTRTKRSLESHLKHVDAKITIVFRATEFGGWLKKNIIKITPYPIGSYDKYSIIGV